MLNLDHVPIQKKVQHAEKKSLSTIRADIRLIQAYASNLRDCRHALIVDPTYQQIWIIFHTP